MMMRKLLITAVGVAAVAAVSCNKVRRSPGRAYMPDMSYSRAYETYAGLDSSKFTTEANKAGAKIFYNSLPVEGTIARGEMLWVYPYKNDSAGYAQSASVKNPLTDNSTYHANMKEAERLYLINCGICHGAKLDGNGPLYKGGEGPFVAKPATLVGDEKYTKMADGTMFHSITYGFNTMGSYAAQLTVKQRWEVIAYIRMKQNAAAGPSKKPADSTGTKPGQP